MYKSAGGISPEGTHLLTSMRPPSSFSGGRNSVDVEIRQTRTTGIPPSRTRHPRTRIESVRDGVTTASSDAASVSTSTDYTHFLRLLSAVPLASTSSKGLIVQFAGNEMQNFQQSRTCFKNVGRLEDQEQGQYRFTRPEIRESVLERKRERTFSAAGSDRDSV